LLARLFGCSEIMSCVPKSCLFGTENRPTIGSTAKIGRSVEIARSVLNQTCVGICSIRSAAETVQHRFCAIFVQLEHRPQIGGAPKSRVSEDIAPPAPNQTRLGISPIRSAAETVQHGFVAVFVQLEHCPQIGSAAIVGGSV